MTDDFSEDAGVGAFPPMGAPALHWPGGNRKNLLFFKPAQWFALGRLCPEEWPILAVANRVNLWLQFLFTKGKNSLPLNVNYLQMQKIAEMCIWCIQYIYILYMSFIVLKCGRYEYWMCSCGSIFGSVLVKFAVPLVLIDTCF